MKTKHFILLKSKTLLFLISSMALAFLITASILMVYFFVMFRDTNTRTINLAADKKALELNYFFNSAENITKELQDYILSNLDEEKLLKNSDYEAQFMSDLSNKMSLLSSTHKGIICSFFRLDAERFGPSKGIFLTGNYQKSYVSVRPTDLSKYSPSDTEHVGWYYLPIWKKAPVWTPPYSNINLSQKMIAYSIPLYRDDRFLGVVGVNLSLGVILDIVNSINLDDSMGILLGEEQNLITLNNAEELSKAVDRSASLSELLDKFNSETKQPLQRLTWDGRRYFARISTLDNKMSYILAVSQDEFASVAIGQIIALLISFIIVSLLTTNLIFYIFKNIINPIKNVTKTTNRLARGELYVDIPYTYKNEIGTLADNIRMMTTQLKEYIEYISEQTKKERAAKEAALTESQINAAASQAKSAFLANMSHEIRTPINAVLGMNEMILRESKDNTITGYASNIKIAGSNLLSIVNDILDFSKIEAGKMELITDNYETSSLIIDLMNMSRERAQKKGLNYQLNISPELPKALLGDSVRIKQCILNLLTNAIKYTKEGSITFSINFEKLNEQAILLKVLVSDTGIGIKSEDMNKLFAPFERIEEEKNRTIEGSGLGISIVRRLLDMMGSKLDVKSVYGKGSDFSFAVEQKVSEWTPIGDLNEAYAQSISQLANYKEKLHAPRAHLLFVDDTEMNLEVIKGLLKNTQMKIDTVLSGKEALEAVKHNRYDILFIDHRMPEMDGIQTLHAMKEMKDNLSAGNPCIALTANAISGVKKMYLDEGFDDYLSKPVNPSKLEEMILKYVPQEYLEESSDEIVIQTDSSDFLSKLHTIDEIDADSAMTNCGSEELLSSTIKKYYETIDEKALELQQYYESEDWENYCIKVHALKSTSRLIGAIKLSKLAEHLEQCSNNHTESDIEEIYNQHKTLLDDFLSFKHILEPVLQDNSDITNKPEISKEELSEKIQKLISFTDDFDIDGLDNIMAELSAVTLPLDFSETFDKIRKDVENVDFKNLRIILSEWSHK